MTDDTTADDSMWDPRPRIGGARDANGPTDGSTEPASADAAVSVLVELEGGEGASPMTITNRARQLGHGFELDEEFEVTPMDAGSSYVVHGWASEDSIEHLDAVAGVRRVWRDTPIAPFGS